jgi:hypothetical protein
VLGLEPGLPGPSLPTLSLGSLTRLWEEVEREQLGVAEEGTRDLVAEGVFPRRPPDNRMLPLRLFFRRRGTREADSEELELRVILESCPYHLSSSSLSLMRRSWGQREGADRWQGQPTHPITQCLVRYCLLVDFQGSSTSIYPLHDYCCGSG